MKLYQLIAENQDIWYLRGGSISKPLAFQVSQFQVGSTLFLRINRLRKRSEINISSLSFDNNGLLKRLNLDRYPKRTRQPYRSKVYTNL